MCNLLSSGEPLPKYIPSFVWYVRGKMSKGLGLKPMLETAKIVMSRRKVQMTEAEEKLFRRLYEETKEERERLIRIHRIRRRSEIMSDVEERVRKIIAEQFGLKPEELRDDMTFAEEAALEDEFGIEIPEEEAQQNKMAGEAIEYVKKLVDPRNFSIHHNEIAHWIDLQDLKKFRCAVNRSGNRFLKRLFTEREINYCYRFKDPIPHLAARFSAKEAFAKALKPVLEGQDLRVA